MQNNTFQEIFETIKSAKKPFTVLHNGPDSDSIGSCISMKLALQQLNIDLDIYTLDTIPDYLVYYLEPEISVNDIKLVTEDFAFNDYDLLVSMDMSEEYMCSKNKQYTFPKHLKKINIDHHSTNKNWGELNYTPMPEMIISCCSILYDFYKINNINITKDMAKALMIGILGDSGGLNYEGTRSKDLRIVADLMDTGVDKFNLYWKSNFNKDFDIFKYTEIIYRNMRLVEKYGYSFITNAMMEQAGIDPKADFASPSDLIKTVKGVDFVFVVAENTESGTFKATFRSSVPNFDTTVITSVLGGGGHKAASGAKLPVTSVEEGIALVEKTINEVLGLHKTTSL